MVWLQRFLVLALLAIAGSTAQAGPGLDPVEALPDAAQEARARALFKQLRCVVCQSESLDDSEADLARDMRRLVRAQVAQGRTDADVKAYLTSRYGDFVLLQPPVRPSTWSLWFGPFVLLLAVLAGVGWMVTRPRPPPEAPLTAEERRALSKTDESLNKT
jgi:cytochrome c-type biogenesis protein CcmH